MRAFLQQVWFHNTLEAYIVALSILVGGWLCVWLASLFIHHRLLRWIRKYITMFDDLVTRAFERVIIPVLYVSIFMVATKTLVLPSILVKMFSVIWACVVMIAVVRIALSLIRHALFEVWVKRRADHVEMERHLRVFMPVIDIVVWGLAIVLLLDNLGFRITAIVAGLGITGIAVALAAQALLGDFFGYLAIMFDQPFEIDDFIIVGDMMGSIEYIGIKTTRIRSLSGEQLIFSNKDLTDSRIRNYKRMQVRRVEFRLSISYETPSEKIKQAVALIKEAIAHIPDTRFDRAHFATYAESSLGIDVVYFVLSSDYNKYMDVHQDLCFKIKEGFEKEGVQFAYPARSIYFRTPIPKPPKPADQEEPIAL